MIRFSRMDKMSIELVFNSEGLDILLNVFKAISVDNQVIDIKMEFDRSVITLRKSSITINDMSISRSLDAVSRIKSDGRILWSLSGDDINYGVEAFETCKEVGYFSPAEFNRSKVKKNKRLDFVYCKLVD